MLLLDIHVCVVGSIFVCIIHLPKLEIKRPKFFFFFFAVRYFRLLHARTYIVYTMTSCTKMDSVTLDSVVTQKSVGLLGIMTYSAHNF